MSCVFFWWYCYSDSFLAAVLLGIEKLLLYNSRNTCFVAIEIEMFKLASSELVTAGDLLT